MSKLNISNTHTTGGHKVLLFCAFLGLISTTCSKELFALADGSSTQAPALNCNELLESAQKLRSVSLSMLATVREQRSQTEKMIKALGPDVAEEAISVLSDQEKQLQKTLRDVEAIHCSSEPTPLSADVLR